MLYSQIAAALEEISLAERSRKAELAASLLADPNSRSICITVRLLLGVLWPPWESREMGIGPEALLKALDGVSKENISTLREGLGETGKICEAALQSKNQHPLAEEPLQAASVYERLKKISRMSGPESEHRKDAVLRGLFLVATPQEGKFIARTALGNMLAGIGPKTMIQALGIALHLDPQELQKAYNLMPEMGLVAEAAVQGTLEGLRIKPGRPIRPMIVCPGKAIAMVPGTFLPKYAGLRVQLHMAGGDVSVFTSRLKNLTASLNGLCQGLDVGKDDWIMDADLIGFLDGRVCDQAEMVRYINRRRLSRRSRVSPALLAYDLIYFNGMDLTALAYLERHKKLLDILGEPKDQPFRGISAAWERMLESDDEVQKCLNYILKSGGRGLVSRDLAAPYCPGGCSERDFLLMDEATISAVVVRAEYGRGSKEQRFTRFQVALKSNDELVAVGWASGGLKPRDASALEEHLRDLALEEDEGGINVRPEVILSMKISGATRFVREGFRILQPKIVDLRFDGSPEEADGLERLDGMVDNAGKRMI
jgi:DNA ligase-1